MARLQLFVLAVLVYTVSAYNLERLDELVREVQALEENENRAMEEADKREIWYVSSITENSAIVQLQRNTDQKNENGYWMLQYTTLDGSEPDHWTNARDNYHRWNDEELSVDVTINGKVKSLGGMVKLTGLRAGTVYNLRSLYSTSSDGSNYKVEPGNGQRAFQTETATSKRLLESPVLDHERREIWYVHDITDTSAVVQLQRTSSQKDGYWMLQYALFDQDKPDQFDWTDSKDAFHHWDDDELSEDFVINGKVKSLGGMVKLTGLSAGKIYNLRTLYSTKSDGSGYIVEPGSGVRAFETKQDTGSKRLVEVQADAQEQETAEGNQLLKRLLDLLRSQENN